MSEQFKSLEEIIEASKNIKHCPDCGDCGTRSKHGCNGTEEDCYRKCPIPVQCEFCYCDENSLFNFNQHLIATLQTHELREKVSWRKYLALDETVDCSFNIFVKESGKILGDIYKEVDGYYVFSALPNGNWNSHALKMIAEILDGKNKEWDEQMKKDLSDDGMTGEV